MQGSRSGGITDLREKTGIAKDEGDYQKSRKFGGPDFEER